MSIEQNTLDNFNMEINKYKNSSDSPYKHCSKKEVRILSELGRLCSLSYRDLLSEFESKEYEIQEEKDHTILYLSKSHEDLYKGKKEEYISIKINTKRPHDFYIENNFYDESGYYVKSKTYIKKPNVEINENDDKSKLYFAYQTINISKPCQTLEVTLGIRKKMYDIFGEVSIFQDGDTQNHEKIFSSTIDEIMETISEDLTPLYTAEEDSRQRLGHTVSPNGDSLRL